MPVTQLSSDLVAAYEDSVFFVYADPAFKLNIGKNSEIADALMRSHKAHTAVVITAYNPYSELLSDDENQKRNNLLEHDLRNASYFLIHAKGQDQARKWPGELSFFVLGIDKNNAIEMAIKYQQNAIVWYELGKSASLLLLR